MSESQNRKWLVELTERQLLDVISCVESIHRFVSGDLSLDAVTGIIPGENHDNLLEGLRKLKPYVTPELPDNAEYGWNGGGCHNHFQRDLIARTYPLYRELRHILAFDRGQRNVYSSPTLTCGYPLPKATPGTLSTPILQECWLKVLECGMPSKTPLLLRLKSGAYVVGRWQPEQSKFVCDEPGEDKFWYADEVKYWTLIPTIP